MWPRRLPVASEEFEPPVPAPSRLREKVIGFRAWQLKGYTLQSVNPSCGGWSLDENRAVCHKRELDEQECLTLGRQYNVERYDYFEHESPHPDCQCGLYAVHAMSTVNHYTMFSQSSGRCVYGAVLAHGALEVHADGFRAQYAKPVLLAPHPMTDRAAVEAIAAEWRIPVVCRESLEELAQQYGSTVPVAARPAAREITSFTHLGTYLQQTYMATNYSTTSYFAASPYAQPVVIPIQKNEKQGGE